MTEPPVAPDDTPTRRGFLVVAATKNAMGWSQCQFCKGYATWPYPNNPAWAHAGDCPIGSLEADVSRLQQENALLKRSLAMLCQQAD